MNFFISFSEAKKSGIILVKCILFIICGVPILHTIGLIGHKLAPTRTVLTNSIEKHGLSNLNAKIITMGNSHNRAIISHYLHRSSLELWSSEQTFAETDYILNFISNRVKNVNIILLPVSIGMTELPPKIRPKTLTNFILLDAWSTLFLSFPENLNSYIRAWAKPLTRNDNWRNPITKLINYDDNQAIVLAKKKESPTPFTQNRAELHIKYFYSSKKPTDTKEKNKKILKHILTKTDELGACLILYQSPVSFPYMNTFISYKPNSIHWKKQYEDFVIENNSQYCVFFLQNLFALEDTKNSRFYRDQDHLNLTGAEIFTQTLKQKITQILPNII